MPNLENYHQETFGIIVEWKDEGPLIMEGKPMQFEDAKKRLEAFAKDSRVIRVAVFRAIFDSGNETLLPRYTEE